MAGANRSVSAGRTYIAYESSSGEERDLYGGGKWGYDRKYENQIYCYNIRLELV